MRCPDGRPLAWASSHTFRRTLVTDVHDAHVPDRQIAGQTGHRQIAVVWDRYIARVGVSTVATDLQRSARVRKHESNGGRRRSVSAGQVGPVGIEPTTRGLKVRCSAN